MIRILKKNLHTTLIILSIDSISWGKFIHDTHQNYPTPSRLSSTHVSTLCLSIIVSQLTSQSNNVRFHSLSLIYYFCLVQSKVTRASIYDKYSNNFCCNQNTKKKHSYRDIILSVSYQHISCNRMRLRCYVSVHRNSLGGSNLPWLFAPLCRPIWDFLRWELNPLPCIRFVMCYSATKAQPSRK